MDLLQLHYFRTVARLEHMTRAAETLNVAQPALSKIITRLERELGVPLFDRQGKRIRLNPYGHAFLDKVDRALNLLEQAKQEVADMAGMERGTIHLATVTMNRFADLLGAFRLAFPDVTIRVTQTTPEQVPDLLRGGDIDFAYTTAKIEEPDMQHLPLLHEALYLAVPPGHRLAERSRIELGEAAEEPFIALKKGYQFRSLVDELCRQAGLAPRIVCEVDETSAVRALVRAGLGVALLPACKSDEEYPLVLVPIQGTTFQRTFHLVCPVKRYLSLAARRFREFAVAYVRGHYPPNVQ